MISIDYFQAVNFCFASTYPPMSPSHPHHCLSLSLSYLTGQARHSDMPRDLSPRLYEPTSDSRVPASREAGPLLVVRVQTCAWFLLSLSWRVVMSDFFAFIKGTRLLNLWRPREWVSAIIQLFPMCLKQNIQHIHEISLVLMVGLFSKNF